MDILLQQTQDRLALQVPELLYLDEDWGQLDFFAAHPPAKFPCGLIDLNQATWSNVLKKAQMGRVLIKIKVADVRLTSTSSRAPQGQKDAGNAFFAILKKVHQALHGWSGSSHYTKLIRESTSKVKRDDGIRQFEIIYSTELNDASAQETMQTVTLSPVISAVANPGANPNP